MYGAVLALLLVTTHTPPEPKLVIDPNPDLTKYHHAEAEWQNYLAALAALEHQEGVLRRSLLANERFKRAVSLDEISRLRANIVYIKKLVIDFKNLWMMKTGLKVQEDRAFIIQRLDFLTFIVLKDKYPNMIFAVKIHGNTEFLIHHRLWQLYMRDKIPELMPSINRD
jgi:hypothetical protein